MDNPATEYRACPHCGGRLVAGATICLHCNEEVSAPAGTSDGALRRFLVLCLCAISLLGLGAMVIIQTVTGDAESSITKPKSPDVSEMGELLCVPKTQLDYIAELKSKGFREVLGRGETRCFLESKP